MCLMMSVKLYSLFLCMLSSNAFKQRIELTSVKVGLGGEYSLDELRALFNVFTVVIP